MNAPFFELQEITFAYPGRPAVLNGAAFQVDDLDRIALVGPNGSGKSTLLHVMVGLLRPQAGEIKAFGRPRHREADFAEVRERAGLLFQDSEDQLFCPTVMEDVAFGPLNLGKSRAEVTEIVRRTLAQLGLQGYEDRITHRLSGGEKRLVSLATVLAMDPDVLLLDEPSCGLDEATEKRLTAILQGLPHAMVIVSHDHAFLDAVSTSRVELRDGTLSDPVGRH